MSAHTVILIFCLSHMCADEGRGRREVGMVRITEKERERERGVVEIPGEADKAVSFIEDIVYVVACCNAMLTFLPIPGSPQGSVRPAGGSV